MKYSSFNSIVPYNGQYILHNTFTNRFLILVDFLKDLLVAAKMEGVDQLEEVHPDFYDALIKGMFLVPNERDEVDEVRKISKRVDMDEQQYKIIINPTMNCNFKCWYCYETHVKASRMDEEIVRRTNAFISTIASSNIKHFNLSWFGGEPLLYYEDIVLPIIKHFHDECEKNGILSDIGFTTNGFLINEKMVKTLKLYNVGSMQITLDGHQEEHDKVRYVSSSRGSYYEIINNVKLLARNDVPVILRINYTLKNIASCSLIGTDLLDLEEDKRKNIVVDFHRVWQDSELDEQELILGQVNTFRNFGFVVRSQYLPNNVIASCYADKKNHVTLNYNGDLFKCTARDFTNAKREGYINESGELVWENNSLEKRLNAKFNNRPCLSCRLLPICNGGCSQHAVEHLDGEDYCVYSFDEKEKDKVIIAKFEEALL